jgi:hypothetical protein
MPDPTEIVEVDAKTLANLQRAKDLLNKVYSDKKHGPAVRRALKDADPTLAIPEDVADEYAAPLKAENDALKKRLDDLAKSLDEDRAKRKDEDDLAEMNRRIDDVVRKRGLTDDGRAGLIETMQKRQIADPEAAALLYLDTLPKSKPRPVASPLPSAFNLMQVNNAKDKTDASVQAFWDNPLAAMENEALAVLSEGEEAA